MNEKGNIHISFSRRKLVEVLIVLVTTFLTSGLTVAIWKYLWPISAIRSGESELLIVKVDDVQIGNPKKFIFNGKASILLKTESGYRAFGAICTHLGCIAYFKNDENLIFCPCHLGRFDRNTGAVISGPPPSPLPAIDIIIKAGSIYATAWRDPDYVKSISFYAGAV
jgi:cytochrome b6-f complex iron-sulfur subunit